MQTVSADTLRNPRSITTIEALLQVHGINPWSEEDVERYMKAQQAKFPPDQAFLKSRRRLIGLIAGLAILLVSLWIARPALALISASVFEPAFGAAAAVLLLSILCFGRLEDTQPKWRNNALQDHSWFWMNGSRHWLSYAIQDVQNRADRAVRDLHPHYSVSFIGDDPILFLELEGPEPCKLALVIWDDNGIVPRPQTH